MTKRTFLVTGASKGIGRGLSDRLVRGGHHVVGLARNRGDFPGELVPVDLAPRRDGRRARGTRQALFLRRRRK
jgi:3-oxoacyl-[acyl-carrier protein] reductase